MESIKEDIEKTKQQAVEAQKKLIELRAKVESEILAEMKRFNDSEDALRIYQQRCKTFGVNLSAYARLGLFLNACASGKNYQPSDFGLDLHTLDGILRHSAKPDLNVPVVETMPNDHMQVHAIMRKRVLDRLGITEASLQ